MADITLILCDVGGVLGTNGWDHVSRADAAKHFGFSFDEFEKRHEDAVNTWESGHMSMDEYLDFTLFYESRPFTRDAFVQFMHDQSRPFDDTIALMRSIAQLERYTMFTMNNESAELHEYRVRKFGLEPIFSAFLTSCYIDARKPHAEFYDRATAIAHAHQDSAVFIDDRPENLAPMRERGFHTIQAHGVESICEGLRALGVTVPTA